MRWRHLSRKYGQQVGKWKFQIHVENVFEKKDFKRKKETKVMTRLNRDNIKQGKWYSSEKVKERKEER